MAAMLPAGNRRRAVTLVEVLLTVGVFAVLIGLLLPAVQQVRAAAARTQAANRLRQITLALHNSVEASGGTLPGPLDATYRTTSPTVGGRGDRHPLFNVWRYMDGAPPDLYVYIRDNGGAALMATLKAAFHSPADPTHQMLPADRRDTTEASSFSANMWAFERQPMFPTGFPDGTSNTFAYAERYAVLPPTDPRRPNAWVYYSPTLNDPIPPNTAYVGNHTRRATFADRGQADVVPVTAGGVSRPSEPGTTFLARPAYRDDYGGVLQSPYPHGLQVAFFDGSVRFLRAGISEQNFWGMVTRDGGEVVTD